MWLTSQGHRTETARRLPGMAILLALMLGLTPAAPTAEMRAANAPARLIPSSEPGWPQWRGPYRDGIARETNLLPQWPEEGPRVLWEIHFLGRGYSSPVIASNRLFITGDAGEHLVIYALDAQGQLLWQATNGASWKDPYPGARASVTYFQNRLYHLNAHGRLACLDAFRGTELWAVDIPRRFQARNITWAFSECLLVDHRKVYVTAGGDTALMAALDRLTGETRWASPPLPLKNPESTTYDRASYASPILIEWGGRQLLAQCSQTHAIGVDADTGALLWTYPMPTTYKVLASTPVLIEDGVFVTGPDSPGGTLLQFRQNGGATSVSPKWVSKLDTCHGGVIHVNDLLVGSWYRGRRGWACLDARTGALLHQTNALAKGSQVFADGLFYWLTEDGIMALVQADREKFTILGQFRFVEKHKNDVWAHPVIFAGRLYLRYHERLVCLDLRRAS